MGKLKGISQSKEHVRKRVESRKNSNKLWHSEETKIKLRKPKSEETKKKMSEACKGRRLSEETKQKLREKSTGRKHSEESIEKMKKNHVGMKGKHHSEESKLKMSKSLVGNGFIGRKHSEESIKKMNETRIKRGVYERTKNRMLNGGSAHANSFVKNPSKPQLELFNLVKIIDIFPVLNFAVKEVNKCIDIALPTRKIAIEYDGSYWHKDEEKDKQRQKQIESLGWKFIRYRDRVPSLDELRSDIYERVAKD